MAQIRQVVSESLQATIRRLLPSQQGFTEDLQATNVITPIIDLTPTAEGDVLPVDLARSISFGAANGYATNNTTDTLANSPGFWRITGVSTVEPNSGGQRNNALAITDGLSTKTVWRHRVGASGSTAITVSEFDYILFLTAGDSVTITSNSTDCFVNGVYYQVADVYGNVVLPSGFSSS